LAVYNPDDTLKIRFSYADGRMPYKMSYEGVTYYLAYDQVGTLKAVADANGNIVKALAYDSFGNMLSDSNPEMEIPFGFAGGLYDKDTGLTRFGYRDYDAETGKWTAKDPIGFDGGNTNLYGYVIGDPVNMVDPVGLKDLTLNQIKDLLDLPDQIQTLTDLREYLQDPENAIVSKIFCKFLFDIHIVFQIFPRDVFSIQPLCVGVNRQRHQ
jgi:RHS repeat-associated protein